MKSGHGNNENFYVAQARRGLAIHSPTLVSIAVCSLYVATARELPICRRWLPPPTQPNGGVGVSHNIYHHHVGCHFALYMPPPPVCVLLCHSVYVCPCQSSQALEA